MIATISKIHERKGGRNYETTFIRVEFMTDDGTWLKTDLCPAYRNYRHWKPVLKVGARLDNLVLKTEPGTEVNADFKPKLLRLDSVIPKGKAERARARALIPLPDPQLKLI